MFMETTHIEIIKRLTHEWEKRAMLMEAIEIFQMLQWTYNYHVTLSKFGVKDDEVENGYKTLCDAYKIKIHI